MRKAQPVGDESELGLFLEWMQHSLMDPLLPQDWRYLKVRDKALMSNPRGTGAFNCLYESSLTDFRHMQG